MLILNSRTERTNLLFDTANIQGLKLLTKLI